MSPSAIVCCFIFTACLCAGLAAGEWWKGAVAGVILAVVFLVVAGAGE